MLQDQRDAPQSVLISLRGADCNRSMDISSYRSYGIVAEAVAATPAFIAYWKMWASLAAISENSGKPYEAEVPESACAAMYKRSTSSACGYGSSRMPEYSLRNCRRSDASCRNTSTNS